MSPEIKAHAFIESCNPTKEKQNTVYIVLVIFRATTQLCPVIKENS